MGASREKVVLVIDALGFFFPQKKMIQDLTLFIVVCYEFEFEGKSGMGGSRVKGGDSPDACVLYS